MFQSEASSSTSTGEEIQAEMENATVNDKSLVEIRGQTKEGEGLGMQNIISNFSYIALTLKSSRFPYYTGIAPRKLDLLLTVLNRFMREISEAKLSSEKQVLVSTMKICLDLQFETLSDIEISVGKRSLIINLSMIVTMSNIPERSTPILSLSLFFNQPNTLEVSFPLRIVPHSIRHVRSSSSL